MAETHFHQGFYLRNLIEKQRIAVSEVSEKSGIARSSLYDIFKKKDINRSDLEAICRAIGADIREFFPGIAGPVVGNIETDYTKLQSRIQELEALVKAKDLVIIQQSEMIEMLKEQISKLKSKIKK